MGLLNEVGVWCTDDRQIAEVAEGYFQSLFTSAQPSDVGIGMVLESVDQHATTEMNRALLQPYTTDEVCRAQFHMHPLKAPGPDGMSPLFFQKYWNVVGFDVTTAIPSVLNYGHLLQKMNYTHIVLVLKKNDPQYKSEFWPISLVNVVSHLFLEVLTNCLKLILPRVISDAQSDFVSERLITDNTTIVFEVLHRMWNRR